MRANPCPNLRRVLCVDGQQPVSYRCVACLFRPPLTEELVARAITRSPFPLRRVPCHNDEGKFHTVISNDLRI